MPTRNNQKHKRKPYQFMKIQKCEIELGQILFGNPISEFKCPEFIEAGLRHLANEIERIEWNNKQEEYEAPISNNGGEYKTDTFEMRAYYWGEDEKLAALPNFKCGSFELRWYKYCGRGMSMNKKIDANEFFEIINKCLESVRKLEKELF